MVDTIDQALNAVGDVVADIADVNILEGLTQLQENIAAEVVAGNVPAVGELPAVGNLVENTINAAVSSELADAVVGEVFHP